MAFAEVASSRVGNSSKTANQASTTITVDNAEYTAGRLAVLAIAVDNNQTTDGDENAVTSISDTRSNTWVKAKAFTNGQGGAQSGATIELWYSELTTSIQNGDTVTINFSNSASRDASAKIMKAFTYGAGNTIAVEATNTLANDGADPGSLNATTANIECLRVRAIAAEGVPSALTITTNWTNLAESGWFGTTGGSGATNMACAAEWRISTGTSDASDPTFAAVDCASVYVAFKEVVTAANFNLRKYIYTRAMQDASIY